MNRGLRGYDDQAHGHMSCDESVARVSEDPWDFGRGGRRKFYKPVAGCAVLIFVFRNGSDSWSFAWRQQRQKEETHSDFKDDHI